MVVRVGTSGWHYRHWRGPFYPETLPSSRMFEHYSRVFDTVELNNTFYRLPPPGTAERWRASAPRGFLYAVKGSRFLTHMKKLKDPAVGLARFFERVRPLGRALGPIVFQLPPGWGVDLPRLETFLQALPPRHRYAFELRDPSWHVEDVYRALRRHRAAFCIFDIAGFESPRLVTTDIAYVRLHGPGPGAYQGSYSDAALEGWVRTIDGWRGEVKRAFVYFDNDQAGYAAHDAQRLRARLAASRGDRESKRRAGPATLRPPDG